MMPDIADVDGLPRERPHVFEHFGITPARVVAEVRARLTVGRHQGNSS
jgi:hypothetical protein